METRTTSCLLAATILALAAGCASFSGSNLVPGKSTAAEVEATMGQPADRIKLPGGDTVWQYPRGSAARQTFAVRIGADGIVREVSQVLTMQSLAKLEIGKSTRDDVRVILGPPHQITSISRIQREVWTYFMFADTRAIITYVQFDQAGQVREVFQVDDPAFLNPGSAGM